MNSSNPVSILADAALLVLDAQAGLFRTDPPPDEADAVLDRINTLIAHARRADVAVIFVQHDGPPTGDFLVPHSEDWALHPRLRREPGDLVIRKAVCDAFYGTTLEATLRARGIKTLVLAGCATDFCIDATLRNAVSRGFAVIVVADAHTTHDGPALKADQIRAHFNWVWANCSAQEGIAVAKTGEISFGKAD